MENLCISSARNVITPNQVEKLGVEIAFVGDKLESEILSIELGGKINYFKVAKVSCNELTEHLEYRAVEWGSGKDKVSNRSNLDLRELIGMRLKVITDEEVKKELQLRSLYC